MTGQHSPGPWRWNGAAGIYAANGKRCANVFVQGEINLPNEEMDANARLIVAAPDLLNALMVAAIHLEGIATGKATKASDFDMAYIKAAIAKAKP